MAKKVRKCEIVQQISYLDMDKFYKMLDNEHIVKYAYIIHDKCTYETEDELKNPENKIGEKKPAHIHCILSLDNSYLPITIANWFEMPEQSVFTFHYIDIIIFHKYSLSPRLAVRSASFYLHIDIE